MRWSRNEFKNVYIYLKRNSNHKDYSQRFREVSSYYSNLLGEGKDLTEQDLKDLILSRSNGIADAGRWGSCNKEQFDSICSIWDGIYVILKNFKLNNEIKKEEYQQLLKIVQDSCGRNKFIIVNRILASFFPEELTATCKNEDFNELANYMVENFENYPKPQNNWVLDNISFMKYCNDSFEADVEFPIPVFSWKLLEIIKNKEIENIISEGAGEMLESKKFAKLLTHTHNLILHGAPGTGKTHLARDIAKAMGCSDNEIGFVQFHPSYDYTDFVEGLRPVNDGNRGQIGFARKDGVFKMFCERALQNLKGFSEDNFEEAYQKLIDKVEEAEESESPYILKTLSHKKEFALKTNSLQNFYAIPQTEIKTHMPITKDSIQAYLRIGEISDWKPYLTAIAQHLIDEFGYKKNDTIGNKKNFIFIIDEINRGEMSKIFGELFFAIEPSYRGAEKCKNLRTQYANLQTRANLFDAALGIKDSDNFGHFFIPENVYIIGTMNDIDRNVESMDFAFRRRFTFKEIKAKDTQQDILAGLDDSIRDDAIRRMNSLNDEISNIEGLSSAYHIGGAYFLKLKELDNDFERLWEYHLEGLLREYLRGMEDADSKVEQLKDAYDCQKNEENF